MTTPALIERMAFAAALVSFADVLEPHRSRRAAEMAPVWSAEMEAAARELLAVMRDESRDHTLWRRTVERVVDDFARRHGLDAEEEDPGT